MRGPMPTVNLTAEKAARKSISEANAISAQQMHQVGAKWPHFLCILRSGGFGRIEFTSCLTPLKRERATLNVLMQGLGTCSLWRLFGISEPRAVIFAANCKPLINYPPVYNSAHLIMQDANGMTVKRIFQVIVDDPTIWTRGEWAEILSVSPGSTLSISPTSALKSTLFSYTLEPGS
ncbi:hypothetical protein LA080_011196 [Diaporthe eres]|nr:hypothetical protein LA080_011196 [Diaporthe eres]